MTLWKKIYFQAFLTTKPNYVVTELEKKNRNYFYAEIQPQGLSAAHFVIIIINIIIIFLSGFSFTNIHDSRDSKGRGRVSI